MNYEEQNVYEAKECLKAHIKFFKSLLKHLKGNDPALKNKSMLMSWCVHRYLNDQLISDLLKAIEENDRKTTD